LDRLPICLQPTLSNDVPMSARKDNDRPAGAAPKRQAEPATDGQGVLSKLPRTRPQRASPRRTAARAASAAKKPASASSPNGVARAPKAGTRAAKSAAKKPVFEPAPRQGFESETDRANGTVQPPGGADLVASAAEIIGEFAKAGVSTGERLLKDFLSRLPLS
jgi:hypothetical protein